MADSKWRTIERWVPLVGKWTTGDELVYESPTGPSAHPLGLCLANVQMNEGSIRATVELTSVDPSSDSAGRILLGFQSEGERYLSVGIGGYGGAFVLSEFVPSIGWRALAASGSRENLTAAKSYELNVSLQGQRVSLDVDGVRVLQAVLDQPLRTGQVGMFAWGTARVLFRSIAVVSSRGAAFVVMQFSPPYQQLYAQVIQPTARRYGLEAQHVGEVFGPGFILQDVVAGLVNAQVVIAEITPANQNVFYELGYAHALGKPTILLAERGKQLPFDVAGYRCVFYDNTIAGKADVEDALSKHLQAIFGPPRDGAA